MIHPSTRYLRCSCRQQPVAAGPGTALRVVQLSFYAGESRTSVHHRFQQGH